MFLKTHVCCFWDKNQKPVSGLKIPSYLHAHIHCTIIHNGHDMDTTCVHWWLYGERKCGVYMCTYKHIYVYHIEYNSVIKKEILPFATTQMDLEGIRWNEINQGKTNIVWSHVCGIPPPKKIKLIDKTDEWLSGWGMRSGWNGWTWPKVQTSSYKTNKFWGYNVKNNKQKPPAPESLSEIHQRGWLSHCTDGELKAKRGYCEAESEHRAEAGTLSL